MHTNGLTDNEHLARLRMDDVTRESARRESPPPRRRALRRHAAARLRSIADSLEH